MLFILMEYDSFVLFCFLLYCRYFCVLFKKVPSNLPLSDFDN